MTDSKPYFASPDSAVLPELANLGDAISALDKTGVVVVKARHPNSKLILRNMEEVLSSVREQHRQKHRRKKELKKLAQIEAAAAACSSAAGVASPGNTTLVMVRRHAQKCPRDDKRRRKKPLQDKLVQENGIHDAKTAKHKSKSPQQAAPYQNGSILQHFQRTPKKDNDANASPNATTKPTNAFEIMMNARNKPVESQTPDKESSISPTADVEVSMSNAKRKLLLQDLADKKGAAKRKLEEESRAAYVELQLEKRAKRFKKMLVNGSSPRGASAKSQLICDDLVDIECSQSGDNTPTRLEEATAEPKRGRGRRPTLSPLDSDQLMEARMHDRETAEFLAKLSSPTKKRDSLLGYFPKKDSSKPNLEATPKGRRGRPPGKRAVRPKDLELTLETVEAPDHTPGGRPRRSCAGRSRYDYDLQESPTKQEKKSKIAKESTISDSEVEVINLDDSSVSLSECTALQGSCKRLAPLFVRSMPRLSLDPDTLKARHLFLMSGVPEKIRLEQKKQRHYEHRYEEELELFPKVSHVLQLDSSEQQLLQQPIALHFKLTPVDSSSVSATPGPGNRRKKTGTRHAKIPTIDKCLSMGDSLAGGQCMNLPALDNKRHVIKEWKTNFERFPTYKCYNQMREKYRHFSAVDTALDTEQVTESFVVTRRTNRMQQSEKKFDPEAEEEKPPLAAPNGELLFTEKYKPMLFDQVLVNLSPVLQLRDFLATWCNGTSGGGSSGSQTLDDSTDLMEDTNSSQQAVCNSVVLLGPGSSGKTNAVFALANEMNFNVLEINAGMRRTGKILMQELQEATQSHQIRKEASTASLGKAQKRLLKRSLSGLKARMQSPALEKDDGSSASELSSNARKCLILIEDADIVFEQTDAGFADAICTLAACSKRPVIIVATNPNCAHLQRLMSQNTIYFAAPNVLNTSKFLSILSLIENCPVQQDDIVSLYLYNRKDLRKTLLELQFFVQSGGDRRRSASQLVSQESQFYASPSKRRMSAGDSAAEQERHEVEQGQQADEQLDKAVAQKRKKAAGSDVYMHRTLFELFTVDQNARWRIPFPVDFRLLHLNVADVFKVAHQLKVKPAAANESSTSCDKSGSSMKRKSRSPKKAWLSSATVAAETPSVAPLKALCEFYENISVAAVVGMRSDLDLMVRRPNAVPHNADRLVPHLAEYIAHDLVERAVTVNLKAESCPYNLFHSPTSNMAIGDYLVGASLSRLGHARFLDYEPAVRAICRSEKSRAALERRSTRFYHYLRGSGMNMVTNFSTEHFNSACDILQEQSAKLTDPESDMAAAPR